MNDILIQRKQILLPIVASLVLAPDCGDRGSAARRGRQRPAAARNPQQHWAISIWKLFPVSAALHIRTQYLQNETNRYV